MREPTCESNTSEITWIAGEKFRENTSSKNYKICLFLGKIKIAFVLFKMESGKLILKVNQKIGNAFILQARITHTNLMTIRNLIEKKIF